MLHRNITALPPVPIIPTRVLETPTPSLVPTNQAINHFSNKQYSQRQPSYDTGDISKGQKILQYKKYSPLYYYDGQSVPGLKFAIYRNLPAIAHHVDAPNEDGYQSIREDSSQLTDLARSVDHKISKKIDIFTTIDVSTSKKGDVEYCKNLLKMAHDAAELFTANACHAETYYKYQAGKVGIVLQAMVKHHRLGNWKQTFKDYFPTLSYETINIWMNVASIPNVERWLFLGVWKLNKIKSACKSLQIIEADDPILEFSEHCSIQLTDEITEKQIKTVVEREKFKNTLVVNSVDLDDDIVDNMAKIKTIQLNKDLAEKLIVLQENDGNPQKYAREVIANKSINKKVSKSPLIPEQIAFDNQVGPLLDSVKLMLKTLPVDIKFDFKRLDELGEAINSLNKHLSRNIYEKAL